MKPEHFQIQFDNPHGVFTVMGTVSGQILLNLSKPMTIRSIKVVFLGEGKSHWSKRRWKILPVHYGGSEIYLNAVIKIVPNDGDSQSGNKELQPGNYAYPFSIQLPGNLPSSFEGNHGYVRYVCECAIDRPWKFNSHIKREFTLIRHLDLNHLSHAPIPLESQVRQKIEGCCFSAGFVEASLSLNKTGYVPGEPIVFDIFIDNQSDYRINAVDLILKQTTIYRGVSFPLSSCHPGFLMFHPKTVTFEPIYYNYRGVSFVFLKSCHPKFYPMTVTFSLLNLDFNIKQRSSESIRRATLVPSLPPSELNGCGIIDIAYTVELKIQCSGSELKIQKNIVLGTIPLQDPTFEVPVQPSALSQQRSQSSPVTVQPQSDNINLDPMSDLPSYEEALAPPPHYSDCVYVRTMIRDASHDDHTTGDTSWAPAYPYYDWSTFPYRGQRPEVANAGPAQHDDD